jgi:hypothetical protein
MESTIVFLQAHSSIGKAFVVNELAATQADRKSLLCHALMRAKPPAQQRSEIFIVCTLTAAPGLDYPATAFGRRGQGRFTLYITVPCLTVGNVVAVTQARRGRLTTRPQSIYNSIA